MSVVLRCPNCGTTRETPGECEACHEARVRYFCANHLPGLWLNEPTCGKCGARFGHAEAAPKSTVPTVARRPPAPKRSVPPASTPRPAVARSMTRELPSASGPVPEPDALYPGPWQRLFESVMRARELSRRSAVPPLAGKTARGCLGRVMLWAVLLFIVLAFAIGRVVTHALGP